MTRRYLDGFVGDAVAAMSGPARVKPSFAALCDATLTFATAVLRHRLEDTASVRLLRRFLAALLPQQADSGTGGNSPLFPHPFFFPIIPLHEHMHASYMCTSPFQAR